MSYFVCQNCQKVSHIFGKKKPETDESKLEADILGMALYLLIFFTERTIIEKLWLVDSDWSLFL